MAKSVLGFREMRQAMTEGRLTITTGKDITKGDVPNKHVHHKHALRNVDGRSLEDFGITFPPILVSHITKQIPKDSKYASYFVHADIYGKWPLGKNRGEDPKGDELFDFLTDLENTYCKCMTEDGETRSAIYLHTTQEPMGRDGKKILVPDVMTLINPVVQYPVFRDGHPQEKERDDSKSPTFKIKLWDTKLTAEKKYLIRPDSLLVHVDPMADPNKDPNDRFLQMIFTKIYDLRQAKNVMTDTYITTESILDEFVYMAGDSNKGKSPFTMLVTISTLAPTWYWEAKKGASIQFKATTMEIFKKIPVRRANARTTEVKINRYQEAMAAMADYGLDQLEDVEEDSGFVPRDEEQLLPSRNAAPATRQLNPSATVQIRPKTNSVCVFPTKTPAVASPRAPPPEVEQQIISSESQPQTDDFQEIHVDQDEKSKEESETQGAELELSGANSPSRESRKEEKQRQRGTKRTQGEAGNVTQGKEGGNFKRRRQ